MVSFPSCHSASLGGGGQVFGAPVSNVRELASRLERRDVDAPTQSEAAHPSAEGDGRTFSFFGDGDVDGL